MSESSRAKKALENPKNLARPLLKWAGGKRQLLEQIRRRLPEEINTYYEPFVGGGAVFFALCAEGRFKKAVLSDQNSELIDTYCTVRDNVEGVIRELRKFRNEEEAYYEVRAQKPRSLVRRAARMIYLNRTGYNGLYRVNRSGQFNVPFGRYVRPNICDEERLHGVSISLRGITLEVSDFEDIAKKCKRGDAVYFDPPYIPVTATAKFAEYHLKAFDDAEHQRLAHFYRELSARGVSVVLSNSDTPRSRELFGDCLHEFVSARRSINSAPHKRGAISEILVYGGTTTTKRGKSL